MSKQEKVRKTIYINKACWLKADKEVRKRIYQGENITISGMLSAIVENHFKTKETTTNPNPTKPKHQSSNEVDLRLLGERFTTKDAKALYIKNGCLPRSAETKLLRMKKAGMIVNIEKGVYKFVK